MQDLGRGVGCMIQGLGLRVGCRIQGLGRRVGCRMQGLELRGVPAPPTYVVATPPQSTVGDTPRHTLLPCLDR